MTAPRVGREIVFQDRQWTNLPTIKWPRRFGQKPRRAQDARAARRWRGVAFLELHLPACPAVSLVELATDQRARVDLDAVGVLSAQRISEQERDGRWDVGP